MSLSTATSRGRFQFRLSDILLLMLAVAIFLTAVRYQSTLAMSVLLGSLAGLAMRRRSALRTNLAIVWGSAAVVMQGFTLGRFVTLVAAHDAHALSATGVLKCLSNVMVLGGAAVCLYSVGVLLFSLVCGSLIWLLFADTRSLKEHLKNSTHH